MIAYRRTRWNFALDRAIEWARELKRPLVVLDALRCDYPWASDRLHRFIFEGMVDAGRALMAAGILHYVYVEPRVAAAHGLLETLCERACVAVTDDFACFFLPRMIRRAAEILRIRLEVVDSSGLRPLRAAPEAFATAQAFRRFLQKSLPSHLADFPHATGAPNYDRP
jgi:deoxyribodipyrimidine photo-lyase